VRNKSFLSKSVRWSVTIGIAAFAALASAQESGGQAFPGYMNFQGRYLAVLSDADMVASAYLDGDLGPRSPELRDELAIIPLDKGLPRAPHRIPVSNAVTSWPSIMALSSDGRFAYVAETDRSPLAGVRRREDLRPSPVVRTVAIGGDLNGRVVQEVETAGRAQGLSLRAQGDLLAVNIVNTPRPQIGFLRVGSDGRLADFQAIDLPGGISTPPRDVSWSPDGEVLAATFPADHAARFYRVRADGDRYVLEQIGEPVVTGKFAGVGQWAPDGRHFFVTNLYWFGGAADLYVGSNVSTLTAIRVDSRSGQHTVVSAAPAGASAENFAIAPDGRTIVTLNMERSFVTPTDSRLTYNSSLTLMGWDPERETLTAGRTIAFEGILPEGIAFDGSGRFLAVANFAHTNPRRPVVETTVNFFRLIDGPERTFVQMDLEVPVMRGAHIIKLQQ
jgi:DNA-binding beta-propeller fold protein YncE